MEVPFIAPSQSRCKTTALRKRRFVHSSFNPSLPYSVQPSHLEPERGEEPPVLAADISLLQRLLDVLLRVLPLRHLLERVVGDGALQSLELQRVTCRHDVVVVDDLDEGLDLGPLALAGLAHAARHRLWVALDAGDNGVREWVGLGALILGLDDDDLCGRRTR